MPTPTDLPTLPTSPHALVSADLLGLLALRLDRVLAQLVETS